MATMTATTTQVYRVFIKATPEAIWDAITTPELTERYFHGVRVELRDGRRWTLTRAALRGTRRSSSATRRGGSCTNGCRRTTRRWPRRSRAG